MYYRPVSTNGAEVPLPWQIKTFHLGVAWPIKDKPKAWVKYLGYISVSLAFLGFLMAEEGQILFMYENSKDVNLFIEVLVMSLVLNECFLRIFSIAFTRNSFKKFLKEFYGKIYIEKKTNPYSWRKINRELIPTTGYSYTFMLSLLSFQIEPLLALFKNERPLPYKMSFHYDLERPEIYAFTLLFDYWIGATVSLFLIGETFLIATFILHLNARYVNLQDDILQCSSTLIPKIPCSQLAFEFRKGIHETYKKNCKLNRFASLLNETYSFRIFVTIAFSASLLCVLSVQVASLGSSSSNIKFVFWMVVKISELLLFGSLGSTLHHTTDKITTVYYLSNWEQIIHRSTNRRENILVIKDLEIIMALNKKPMQLSGLNFFNVSLDTTVAVLRGAFSYFTCLYTIKESIQQ